MLEKPYAEASVFGSVIMEFVGELPHDSDTTPPLPHQVFGRDPVGMVEARPGVQHRDFNAVRREVEVEFYTNIAVHGIAVFHSVSTSLDDRSAQLIEHLLGRRHITGKLHQNSIGHPEKDQQTGDLKFDVVGLVRVTHQYLSIRALSEALDCFILVLERSEDGVQLGHHEDAFDTVRDVEQFQVAAVLFDGGIP